MYQEHQIPVIKRSKSESSAGSSSEEVSKISITARQASGHLGTGAGEFTTLTASRALADAIINHSGIVYTSLWEDYLGNYSLHAMNIVTVL